MLPGSGSLADNTKMGVSPGRSLVRERVLTVPEANDGELELISAERKHQLIINIKFLAMKTNACTTLACN